MNNRKFEKNNIKRREIENINREQNNEQIVNIANDNNNPHNNLFNFISLSS